MVASDYPKLDQCPHCGYPAEYVFNESRVVCGRVQTIAGDDACVYIRCKDCGSCTKRITYSTIRLVSRLEDIKREDTAVQEVADLWNKRCSLNELSNAGEGTGG